MPKFEPRDPDFEAKVRESFGKQTAMQTLGAVLGRLAVVAMDRTSTETEHGIWYISLLTDARHASHTQVDQRCVASCSRHTIQTDGAAE